MSSELFDVSLVAQRGRAQQGIRALSVLARDRAALAGGIVLAAVVLCAVLAPVIAPDPPLRQDERNVFAGPSSAHLLGTDNFGRDIFSRLLYGGRTALVVGALSVLLALAVGTVLGVIAGYRGGKLDSLIMRGVDVLLAFPLIILAILIVVALGAGITNLIIAVAIVQIPLFTRLARSATLGVGAEEYLQAAVVTGAGGFWIVRQHVLPNILPLLFVQATTSLGIAILNAAALNFLGLGVQPPSPDWGRMVAEFSSYAFTKPELPMYPGLAIVITVLAANMLGDGLLKIVDPVGQKLSL
jgi:ABC-type dipeptide/oligopeptide/nickel transport system permease subunit